MTGNAIVPSRTSILETLPRVLANPPKISPKSSVSTIGTIFYKMKSAWTHHPWLSSVILIAFIIGSFVGTKRLRRRTWGSGGFFNLENLDKEKGLGFLGNGAPAKED
jgi:protein disulfide-isomerase